MRQTILNAGLVVGVAVIFGVAERSCAQSPPPPPSLEDRLDQCNVDLGMAKRDAGDTRMEAARLNYQLREASKALAAAGFRIKDGKWGRVEKDEPKTNEEKK